MNIRLVSFTIIFLALVSLFVPAAASAAIPSTQRAALVDFYRATGGDQWAANVRRNWLGAPGTECSWAGIRCDAAKSTVTGVVFHDSHLVGQIPESLGALRDLTEITLIDGQLAGSLPHSINRLSKLRVLQVRSERLVGIPPEIGGLKSLEKLVLSDNLIRKLPAELENLVNLSVLDLSGNRISGEMPELLAGLPALQSLDLSGNRFTPGPVPDWMRQLKVTELRLRSTARTGEIPGWLRARSIERLDLGRNAFTPGPIPSFLSIFQGLRELRLDGTQRTGTIPAWLGERTFLDTLVLADNAFDSGPVPDFAADSSLLFLDLGNTGRTGLLPATLAQNNPNLIVLRLDRNALQGPIPEAWASLRDLRTLRLESNRLSGALPRWLMDFGHLGELPSSMAVWMHHNDEGVGIDLRWNVLASDDPQVMAFVRSRQVDGADFLAFQTAPPANLTVVLTAPGTVLLTWSPAGISTEMGYYRVFSASSIMGPFSLAGQTDTQAVSFESTVKPGMLKCFLLRAVTPPHAHNASSLVSPPTSPVCVAK
jgi:Leucine-rich repeat (LRR) protein